MRFTLSLSLTIIGFFVAISLFAEFFAPYPYDLQNRKMPYHPPTRIHILHEGKLSFPFIYKYNMKDPLFKVYEEDRNVRCKLKFFTKTPYGFRFISVEEPCRLYLLGGDKLGRDIFSRLIYGGRVSLSISLIGVLITFTLGAIIGGFSGYFGGRIDNFAMRLVEVLMAIPTFYLMLSLRAVFPLDMSSIEIFLMIVFILSFIGWAGLSRVVRGIVLSVREKEFVLSARACGAGSWYILRKHILPNTYFYLIVSATLSIPAYILGEASLSLLGLGIQEPFPSWGNMLSDARSINLISSYPWILSPSIPIFLIVLAFNLLGDTLLRRK